MSAAAAEKAPTQQFADRLFDSAATGNLEEVKSLLNGKIKRKYYRSNIKKIVGCRF